MQVKLDDDVLAPYHAMAEESKQPLSTVLERQLARFSTFPSTIRVLPLGRDALQQVETLLGGGQLQTPIQLVDRVRAYSQVRLGRIDLDLSLAQKEELAHRAAKQGKTTEALITEMVVTLVDQMFDAITPYR